MVCAHHLRVLPVQAFRIDSTYTNKFAGNDSIINGTMAIMVTDLDLFVTPFNTTMLNPHIIALGVSYSLSRSQLQLLTVI